jgi:putative phosphoesterase
MRLLITGDTHMPKGARELPGELLEAVGGCQLIVHTGDFSGASMLELFRGLGPDLLAVAGNVEDAVVRSELPETLELEAGGVRLGLIHDAGPAKGRLARMRRRFPGCVAVLFGHSHIPLLESDRDGFQIFNPGSPTERRRQPRHSFGIAETGDGNIAFEHVWI